jgi:three-Cys-motif partner protein
MSSQFFEETTEQSTVKATIVSKYFWAWAKVIIPTAKQHGGKIVYLDLFAGPGRYKDGAKSTPLMVLEKAITDPDMCQMLVAIFNDKDEAHVKDLANAITSLPGIEELKHKPEVYNEEVGTRMVNELEGIKLAPTLFFVDPWGYKGLSLQLVNAVVKDWACECIFFFNYNRISMGINNPYVEEHMDALFGKERADELRAKTRSMSPPDRELAIVEELSAALNPTGKRFVLPFRFKNERGTRTSHHLIFVSKHFRGYEIMKQIMAKESSSRDQGVPSFEYSLSDMRFPLLFELSRPLDDLEGMLLEKYAGKTLTMHELYAQHNVGRRYIASNYKDVLKQMEASGKVTCDPPAARRRRDTMADHVKVSFPLKGGA